MLKQVVALEKDLGLALNFVSNLDKIMFTNVGWEVKDMYISKATYNYRFIEAYICAVYLPLLSPSLKQIHNFIFPEIAIFLGEEHIYMFVFFRFFFYEHS